MSYVTLPATLSALAAALVLAGPAAASELLDLPPTLTVAAGLASPQGSRASYMALITREAERRGLPPALGHAVATIESGWDPAARGTSGEVGLMQVMPATAAMLGFRGTTEQLADPETNIKFGVQYLSAAWVLAAGEPCTALMKYRAGHGETVMTLRSVQYCQRAERYLASVNSPLAARASVFAATVHLQDPADAPSGLPRSIAVTSAGLLTSDEWMRLRTGHRTAEDSARFWAARAHQLVALRAQHETLVATRMTLTRPVHLAARSYAHPMARAYASLRFHHRFRYAVNRMPHPASAAPAEFTPTRSTSEGVPD